MEWQSALTTVGAAAFGWLLGEASQLLKGKRQYREAVGMALADLLALWHDLLVIEILYAAITDRLKLCGNDARAAFQGLIETRLSSVGLQERLRPAVSCLASFDPLLASDLRTKASSAESFMDDLRQSQGSLFEGSPAPPIALIKKGIQRLSRRIARRHGIRTWFRVSMLFLAQGYPHHDLEALLVEAEEWADRGRRMRPWQRLSSLLPSQNFWDDGSLLQALEKTLEPNGPQDSTERGLKKSGSEGLKEEDA